MSHQEMCAWEMERFFGASCGACGSSGRALVPSDFPASLGPVFGYSIPGPHLEHMVLELDESSVALSVLRPQC